MNDSVTYDRTGTHLKAVWEENSISKLKRNDMSAYEEASVFYNKDLKYTLEGRVELVELKRIIDSFKY